MAEKRFITFIICALAIMLLNFGLMAWLNPKKPAAKPEVAQKGKDGKAVGGEKKPGDKLVAPGDKPVVDAPKQPVEPKPGEKATDDNAAPPTEEEMPQSWVTLGSIDRESGYRMLVTLTNKGAAIERIELNSPRFTELDYDAVKREQVLHGYLGQLNEVDAPDGKGCLVRVVGPGTPAALAGLKAGDVIIGFDNVGSAEKPLSASRYRAALRGTRPNQEVKLTVAGKDKPLVATLRRIPLNVTQPEGDDQLSCLLTLDRVDETSVPRDADEIPGVNLRQGVWKIEPGASSEEVTFSRAVPKFGLEVVKRYRLAKAPQTELENRTYKAYHLELGIELRNVGEAKRDVAYRLDGPTSLPLEGSWFAYKISSGTWGAIGVRDVVGAQWAGDYPKAQLVSSSSIAEEPDVGVWKDKPLTWVAVDALYFASALIPQLKDPEDMPFAEAHTLRVGPEPKDASRKNLTNVSFRIISKPEAIAPQGALKHDFTTFAGPKLPDLLVQYQLQDLVDYGWFGWVSTRLLWVLHFFYGIVGNYGIAIIMLTVLVRMCMFPISRKQALNAQKMQELQPEMKKIAEKYKNNLEQRGKAQQELFKKHNYSPLAGCLPMFLQLPIFIGLYRSLSVDVELRQAPLISEAVRWCSNLGAPDMLWYWEPYLPDFIVSPFGSMFLFLPTLGPFLNLLPLFTIALFIVQQKMFMPPPTDEQTAMQQKMMKYMMILMGFMFFKVAAGLCLYFIASSLWSIAEKKLLPKTLPAAAAAGAAALIATSSNGGNGSAGGSKKKQGGRKG